MTNLKLPHRQFLRLAAGAAALPAVSRMARAQAYPTRPVKWIVGVPPGGGADTVARVMGSWLSYGLGCETDELPTFVVLPDPRGLPTGGTNNWTGGFLPARHQGVASAPASPRRSGRP